MAKNIIKNQLSGKQIIVFIFKILLVLFGLIVLYVVGVFATSPLFDKFDHDRFITLDTQMQEIFNKIKIVSNGADDWQYSKICSAEMTGDWQTGKYFCSVIISVDKTVTSVDEVNFLQNKYYPVINSMKNLKSVNELSLELPNEFGKQFVVSGAYKKYEEIQSGIGCDYLAKLYQSFEDVELVSDNYGSKINGGIGKFKLQLDCTDKARSHWYPVDKIASTFTL